MLLGAACYFDCGCIYCFVTFGKFYVYFMRVCYKFDISISMLLLALFCPLCLMIIKCYRMSLFYKTAYAWRGWLKLDTNHATLIHTNYYYIGCHTIAVISMKLICIALDILLKSIVCHALFPQSA